jgi:peptide/nickel transport system substrate-binding protein
VDIIHTSTPNVTASLEANTSLAYINDVKTVAGEPDMDCVLLNLAKAPFDNLKVRQAAAMAFSSEEYSKVITNGVEPVSDGPFVAGSPYHAPTGYPAPNVAMAKKLIAEVQQETGKPVSLTINHVPDPSTTRIAEFVQQQFQTAGMQVDLTPIQQAQIINTALIGTFQAQIWRQFGAVDPDLNYIPLLEPDQHHPGVLHQHGPQRRPGHADGPPQGTPVTEPGRPHRRLSGGRSADGVGHPLSVVGPHRVVDRRPTQGGELQQPDHPVGRQGVRNDHRGGVAHPDLAELLIRGLSGRRAGRVMIVP